MNLARQIEDAEAELARLKARQASAPCREVGCQMIFFGGRNAGCEHAGDSCTCSVPVHVCPKCGDSDYGDNADAAEIISQCAKRSLS